MYRSVLLKVRGVSFSYRGNSILRNVNLTLHGGMIVGLVGPNGVGKTTLLSLLVGDLVPNVGDILVNDKPVHTVVNRCEIFGLSMPTYGFSPSISVCSALSDIRRVFGVKREIVDDLVDRFGVRAFQGKKVGKLSTGMRKKFDLVVAAMNEAPIMILDEPTNGLDVESVGQLREFIEERKRQGALVLLSSHVMAELDVVADCIIGVHEGHVTMLESFCPGVSGSAEKSYKVMSEEKGDDGDIR